MDKTWKRTGIALLLSLFIMLSACTNPRIDDSNKLNTEQIKSVYDNPPEGAEDLVDPLLNSDKSKNKTKTHDKTDIPETHDASISSYFESVLKEQDIQDVKVFNIDDSVILAQIKPEKNPHDHLSKAQILMENMFHGQVKILTATDPQAADLISQIEKNMKDTQYQEASNDILQLLNMAK